MTFNLNIIIENYRKITIGIFLLLIALTLASITVNIIGIGFEKDFTVKASATESEIGYQEGIFEDMSRSVDSYSSIIDRNIFDSQNRQPDQEKKSSSSSREGSQKKAYDGPPVKSSMNATLVGTMVFSNPSYSFARISKGSGGEVESFYTGDDLYGEATIKKVERNRVYIDRDGRIEFLEIVGSKGTVFPSYASTRASMPYFQQEKPEGTTEFSSDDVKSVGDNKFVINRKMLDSMLSNYNSVLTQARAVPNMEDGKANGFKIFAIRDGSIYSAIGIKNGDVLTRVNNGDINNLEKVLSLFTQLRNESNITIDLIRGGQRMSYQYEIR
jgi:general secretion pathway protein C